MCVLQKNFRVSYFSSSSNICFRVSVEQIVLTMCILEITSRIRPRILRGLFHPGGCSSELECPVTTADYDNLR